MAYDADPVTLDIHEQLSGGILQLSHMSFDPLLRWTKDLGFEPRLAESWERVDDKTMRFKLREGVKFHSGNELTTADVKFTFERLKESQDFKAKATKARQAQSRVKALERMEKIAPAHVDSPFSFEFPVADKVSNPLLSIRHGVAGHGDVPILKNINVTLLPGTRVGCWGRTGR